MIRRFNRDSTYPKSSLSLRVIVTCATEFNERQFCPPHQKLPSRKHLFDDMKVTTYLCLSVFCAIFPNNPGSRKLSHVAQRSPKNHEKAFNPTELLMLIQKGEQNGSPTPTKYFLMHKIPVIVFPIFYLTHEL